jgi:hypothetical protein
MMQSPLPLSLPCQEHVYMNADKKLAATTTLRCSRTRV